MHDQAVPYRYPLAPLLRHDEWERDTLALELQRARLAVEEAQRQLGEAAARVAEAERRMREMHGQDCRIAPEASRMLQLYLRDEYAERSARQARVQQAEQLAERIGAQLAGKRLEVRTLERHRDRRRQEHELGETRRLQGVADESWLVFKRGRA